MRDAICLWAPVREQIVRLKVSTKTDCLSNDNIRIFPKHSVQAAQAVMTPKINKTNTAQKNEYDREHTPLLKSFLSNSLCYYKYELIKLQQWHVIFVYFSIKLLFYIQN